jgi:hypothetical protein
VPECGLADSRTDVQKAKIQYDAFVHQISVSQVNSNLVLQGEMIWQDG